MRCPAGLTAEGKAAFRHAVEQLADPDAHSDAVLRYVRAVDAAARMHQQWADDGYPATTLGGATGAAVVPHPLPKMVRDAQAFAQSLGDDLNLLPKVKRGVGRPRGVAQAPDRVAASEPPRLTAVKGGRK